jgi:hypothetical protein
MTATPKAMMGDMIPGAITEATTPWNMTLWLPSAAIVAPMMPPMSAWLDDDGSVKYQVMRFQMIAPIKAANTSDSPDPCSNDVGLTMPLAIVAATLIEMNAPTRFRTAAIATATRGFSAPVAIDVATALAVSWKPLVKSKQTAVMTTRTKMNMR